jgi:signal transduction histidine kinase
VETLANLDSLLHSSGTVVTADPLPSVMGDAPQLSQLLQNLIENGTKYCEEPVARIHIAAARAQDTWLFSVSDNGIGIPKEHFRKVFEPLKRLNGASKCEGTGLGLATCERIVERHGGRIWCESNEGQGTTFQFTLGAADAAIANPE